MNIITVGYLHGAGGAERQIILLSNQLAKRGHCVTLCVLAENKSSYNIAENVRVVDLSTIEDNDRFWLSNILKRLVIFRRFVKKERPDIIINYNLQSAYFCLTINKRNRGKVIYSERGDPFDDEYSGLLGIIRDYSVKQMDGVVFQSEGARDFFPRRIKDKSIVIHNSVNIPLNKYSIPHNRDKRIINVGRLHPQKNQKLLIKAFSIISDSFPEYMLEIYGDGDLQKELQQTIDDLRLTARVKLLPSRSDIWDYMVNASLFVLSSDYEGMPNALMEAMALGLPCISTDCRPGGARSLIEDGVNGIIVPVGDVVSLSMAISLCLTKEDLRNKLSLNARKIVETHSETVLFDKWEEFLERFLII